MIQRASSPTLALNNRGNAMYKLRSWSLSLFLLLFALPAAAEEYDLVILGGRVMDPESNLDAVRNVGIKGGKIAKVTKRKISGKQTIDATGHVVAPGFIDLHVHGQDPYVYPVS